MEKAGASRARGRDHSSFHGAEAYTSRLTSYIAGFFAVGGNIPFNRR